MPNTLPTDWLYGLGGGILIGLGGAVFLLGNGRVMGASGILGGLVDGSGKSNIAERLAFLAGVFLMPVLLNPMFSDVDTHATTNIAVLIAAGLCVGVGTRLAMAAPLVTASVASPASPCAGLWPPSSTSWPAA